MEAMRGAGLGRGGATLQRLGVPTNPAAVRSKLLTAFFWSSTSSLSPFPGGLRWGGKFLSSNHLFFLLTAPP